MRRKLSGSRGFSLSEMLVAVAILGLLSAAMGTGIPVAVRAYQQVTASSEASVLCSTLSTALADELRFAANPRTAGEGGLVFDSPVYGGGVGVGEQPIPGKSGQSGVTVGGKQLLGPGAYTSGLSASAQLHYTAGAFWVDIQVTDGERTWAEAAFNITPLNVS